MRSRRKTSQTEDYEERNSPGASLKIGAVAVTFLVIGYQAALFVNSSAVAQLIANRDAPDTVYVTDEALAKRIMSAESVQSHLHPDIMTPKSLPPAGNGRSEEQYGGEEKRGLDGRKAGREETTGRAGASISEGVQLSGGEGRAGASVSEGVQLSGSEGRAGASVSEQVQHSLSGAGATVRRNARHSEEAERIYLKQRGKKVESFPFDPNSVSVSDLQRLGFSEKQALSIDAYRKKGGRFRRPADFAKSYVVADSVFSRLEPFIRIPKVDINAADSAAFDALPGIGAYYAAKMVEYRERLQGYSYPEQLMDLKNFDEERFRGLADLISVGAREPYALWSLPAEQLAQHPYISSRAVARSIVLFRENHRPEELSVKALAAAGILDSLAASRLGRCRIAPPGQQPPGRSE